MTTPKPRALSKRHVFKTDQKSLTQQHFKQECDVNSIIEKYRRAGMPLPSLPSSPDLVDYSQYQDFRTNLEMIHSAESHFSSLPAPVRKRFGNDPANLLEFIQDSSNREEAIKLGLLQAPPQSVQNDDQTTNQTLPKGDPATQA